MAPKKTDTIVSEITGDNVADKTREGYPTLPETDKGYTQSQKSYNFTTKQQANFSLEQAWLDMFGVAPSAKVKSQFYASLNKMEKKYAGTQFTSGKGGSSSTTSKAYTFSTADVIAEFVNASAPAMFKKGFLGESAAKVFDAVVRYGNNMGVAVSPNVVLSQVTNNVLKKKTLVDIQNDYREEALKMYPGLSKRLKEDPELTVRDLASSYINRFSEMYDTATDKVSLTDPNIQDALSKNMGMPDFINSLKKRADYGVTNFAKKEASDLAGAFKQAWGF
jgi:hypothetical protein